MFAEERTELKPRRNCAEKIARQKDQSNGNVYGHSIALRKEEALRCRIRGLAGSQAGLQAIASSWDGLDFLWNSGLTQIEK